MKKMIPIVCVFMFILSAHSVYGKNAEKSDKEIVYNTFPALDSVLSILVKEKMNNKHNTYVYAHLECIGKYVYEIYIDGGNNRNVLSEDGKVIKAGNRYLKIGDKKIPVYLEEYDNMFVAQRDKDVLPGMIIWHGIIVTFNAVEQTIISIK